MLNQMFITVAGAAALALPIATVADHVGSHGQSGVAGKSPVAQVLPESAVSAGTDVQVSTTAAPRLVSEIPADANSSGASSAVDPTLEVAPATASPVVVRHVKVNAPSASSQPVAAPSAAVPTASAPDESVSMMTRATTDPPVDPAVTPADEPAVPADEDPALAGAPDDGGTSDSGGTVVPGAAQTVQEVWAALSPEQRAAREKAQGILPWWIPNPGQPPLSQDTINKLAPNGVTGFETPVPKAGNLSLNDTMAALEARYRNGQADPMGYADAYNAAVDAWYAANS